MSEDINNKKSKKWITYVIRKPSNGEFVTFSEPYDENSEEHDVAPNQKSFLALYKGDSIEETIGMANDFIMKIQEDEIKNMSFERIREITKKKDNGSYVEFPNGTGYRIKTMDEVLKEEAENKKLNPKQ